MCTDMCPGMCLDMRLNLRWGMCHGTIGNLSSRLSKGVLAGLCARARHAVGDADVEWSTVLKWLGRPTRSASRSMSCASTSRRSVSRSRPTRCHISYYGTPVVITYLLSSQIRHSVSCSRPSGRTAAVAVVLLHACIGMRIEMRIDMR